MTWSRRLKLRMTSLPAQMLNSTARDRRAVIALSEGADPRIVEGACAAEARGLADIILVGSEGAVSEALAAQGETPRATLRIMDPQDSPLSESFAAEYHWLRSKRGVDLEAARAAVRDPLVFSAMLVRLGHADGTVGGAVAATSDVVRAALQVIGKAEDTALVSSFFLMYPPEGAGRPMLYSDCGLVIDPSPEDMVSIAAQSARSFTVLMQATPKVAMLSFSTKGSARHAAVDKVSQAARAFAEAHPDVVSDGELQFDAAFVPSVSEAKAPGSPVAGEANVMIFPNLDAGNIAYKITQRLGGYVAIGPVLQGLARPANDLSRGCVASDVTQMIAVTALQAADG